jgi:hypothetical protein
VAKVVEVTELDVAVNVAEVAPAATVVEAGTVTAPALLDNETDKPPGGAAVVKVMVPVENPPPATLVGLRETADRAAVATGVTASEAVLLTVR